jgi:hypothetical protein
MQTELDVMAKIAALLEPLDQAARSRVLNWVIGALAVEDVSCAGNLPGTKQLAAPSEVVGKFSTFAELFHAAAPDAEKEKALVAAYWIQQSSGVDQFASQQVNTELKNIGYGVTNITDALTQLISDKPNLVIQLAKSGSTKQARKTYKITDAGLRRVLEMLNSSDAIQSS